METPNIEWTEGRDGTPKLTTAIAKTLEECKLGLLKLAVEQTTGPTNEWGSLNKGFSVYSQTGMVMSNDPGHPNEWVVWFVKEHRDLWIYDGERLRGVEKGSWADNRRTGGGPKHPTRTKRTKDHHW